MADPVQGLLKKNELGNDAKVSREAGPGLAQTTVASPALFHQTDLLSRCTSHNLIPAGNTVLQDSGPGYDFTTGQPNYREFFYSTVQLAGESQLFDGSGSFVRFQAGGGPTLTQMTNPGGGFRNETLWSHNISPPIGSRPVVTGKVPPFRSDVPCYKNAVPDLNGPLARSGPPDPRRSREARDPRALRDFIAIGVLAVLAIVTTSVILVRQQANFPSWVPILGQSHFELKAEFSSAQAVTPGQGQTVDLSGVKIGSVQGVNLESGRAVVTMNIDPKYAPLIHTDASLLLRPRTGLQDMTIEIDPGQNGQEVQEGSTIPLANTEPNVNPDQILASLDGDTQSFLQLLVQGGAQGLYGHSEQLSAGLRRFDPTVRDIARINSALVKRRQNLRRVITNFGKLSAALGKRDTQLARFVRSSNTVFGSFAKEQNAIRATLQEFPPTLQQTQSTLTAPTASRRYSGLRPAS